MRWTAEGLEALLQLRLVKYADTGGCNSFTRQSLLSADTDPFRLDSQFEFSRTYSHQYEPAYYESFLDKLLHRSTKTAMSCDLSIESTGGKV